MSEATNPINPRYHVIPRALYRIVPAMDDASNEPSINNSPAATTINTVYLAGRRELETVDEIGPMAYQSWVRITFLFGSRLLARLKEDPRYNRSLRDMQWLYRIYLQTKRSSQKEREILAENARRIRNVRSAEHRPVYQTTPVWGHAHFLVLQGLESLGWPPRDLMGQDKGSAKKRGGRGRGNGRGDRGGRR